MLFAHMGFLYYSMLSWRGGLDIEVEYAASGKELSQTSEDSPNYSAIKSNNDRLMELVEPLKYNNQKNHDINTGIDFFIAVSLLLIESLDMNIQRNRLQILYSTLSPNKLKIENFWHENL